MMTKREKQLLRESFQAIRADAEPLAMLFYGRLFEMDSTLRPMFHGDMGRQGTKLVSMLAAVIDSLDRFDSLKPTLQAMGQRHTSYGVASHHYEMVEHAWAWALGQALETSSGSEVVAAWRKLIRQVSTVMMDSN
jgi:hemoglobin-like flavoprotein